MKIKQLIWSGDEDYDQYWATHSPISHVGIVSISFEEGQYWPSVGKPEGELTLEAAKKYVQELHEEYIMEKYLED